MQANDSRQGWIWVHMQLFGAWLLACTPVVTGLITGTCTGVEVSLGGKAGILHS